METNNDGLKKLLANLYIVDYAKKLVRTGNIGIMIYLSINLILYIALFGGFMMPAIIPMAIMLYLVSVTVALSPIGEFILRIQSGARKLKKFKKRHPEIEQRLVPIFERVYAKARAEDPSILPNVQIFVSRDKCPNAFATGRRTICVTQGLLNYSDEEIEGVLAHEFGHIAHKDTDTLLVILVSNMLLTAVFFIFRVIVNLFIFALGQGDKGYTSVGNFLTQIFIDLFLMALMNLWMKIGLLFIKHSNRQNEYEADNFACLLGYKNELFQALEKIGEGEEPSGFFANLASTHPDTEDRLDRIYDFDESTVRHQAYQQVQQDATYEQAYQQQAYQQQAQQTYQQQEQPQQAYQQQTQPQQTYQQQEQPQQAYQQQTQPQQTYQQQTQPQAAFTMAAGKEALGDMLAYMRKVPVGVAGVVPGAGASGAVQRVKATASGMPIFTPPKAYRIQEKLYAKYGDGTEYYYGQIQTIENGHADFVFFDGVRQWIPTSMLIKVEDMSNEGTLGANWNKQGVYYPCTMGNIMENDTIEIIYGDGRSDVLPLSDIRITKA